MNQPLAPSLGNALEVAECMDVLCGEKGGPLAELSVSLGGVLLANAGLATDVEDGVARMVAALANGSAAEAFGKMVTAHGGPVKFIEEWRRFLPEASVIRPVKAARAGYISAIDGEALGLAVVGLGGGRQVESDVIDPAVGFSEVVRLGDRVEVGDNLLRLHASREDAAANAENAVRSAIVISDEMPDIPPLIHVRNR